MLSGIAEVKGRKGELIDLALLLEFELEVDMYAEGQAALQCLFPIQVVTVWEKSDIP